MKKIKQLLILLCVTLLLTSCGEQGGKSEMTSFSFKDAVSVETLKTLSGKPVSIIGYMATLSPISGKYIYLMNMPYQSCPFCVPNTTQLANTMAVYAPDGKTFKYTDQAVKVEGTLEFGDYTDEFGYVYPYRIVNASAEPVDLSTVSADYALWQSIASDGIVSEISGMFDFLHFLCQWSHYESGYTDENGNEIRFFLYPGDVDHYLKDDGPYGYANKMSEGYFPGLTARIRGISDKGLESLEAIVTDAQKVEQDALNELEQQNYSFDQQNECYIQTRDEELYQEWQEVYTRFAQWLASWEV